MFKNLFRKTVIIRRTDEDLDYAEQIKSNCLYHYEKELKKIGDAFLEKLTSQAYSTDIFADISKKFEIQNIKNGSYEHQFIAHYEELEAFKKQINMGAEVLRERIKILYDMISRIEKTLEENHIIQLSPSASYAAVKIGLNAGMDKKTVEEKTAQSKKIKLGMSINKVAKKSGKRTAWSDELEKKAISLRAYGFGYASVAKKLGVSAGSVRNHLIPLGK